MNSDIFHGKWMQLRGMVKKQWGKLTDDDLDQVNGDLDRLAGILQERYGYTREEVEKDLEHFVGDSDDRDMKKF